MPTPRAGMASGTLNGHIQVWGGEGPSGAPTSTYRQGEDYDPRTNTWITIADELTPRHGTDGATLGDKIYVPGGGPASGSSVTDVHEVFSFVSSAPPTSCIPRGSDPATTDSDGDRYTNKDEADNETDPCSPASTPPDFDNDFVSDRNDPDDDADGVPDSGDQFQLDPANGSNTALPWVQNWNPGDVPAGKFANSGFPGVQLTTNGSGFIADRVHAGGAGGYMTVSATGGTNRGVANDQDNALQVGFDARDATRIATRIADPLSGGIVEPGKAGGVFVGLDEDNFVELALATDNGSGSTGLVFGVEVGGAYVANPGITPVNLPLPGMTSTLDLVLSLHPGTKRITAQYRVNSDNGADLVTIGSVDAVAFPALAAFFELGAATGVFTTNSTVSSFGLAYDYFRVEPAPTATVTVNTAVVPASDPGRFNLQIDGVTKAADVGDGGTTGAQIVFPGTHTVGETAGTGTSLSEYAVTIGGDCAANGTVALAAGESKQCTITNTRRAAAVHVADLFTTDAAGAPRATFARGDAVFWRIKIVDEAGAPVAGASVTSAVVRPKGTVWTTPFATTGADGWAAFSQKTQKGNPTGTYTIRITDVNAPGRAYDPTANVRSETTFVLQ
jgi:hypothetical protein